MYTYPPIIYLSTIYLSIYPSIYLSIYLSFYTVQVKKRDELIHKDKLDPLAMHNSHMAAMTQFGMGPMGHMLHTHGLPHL